MEIGKLMKPKLQKHSGLKLAVRMNETQILQTQCRNICKLNSSRAGGYNTRDCLVPVNYHLNGKENEGISLSEGVEEGR